MGVRVGEALNFCTFKKENTQTKGRRQTQLALVMATTDSFSLQDLINCFNHHIDDAALLQSNAK